MIFIGWLTCNFVMSSVVEAQIVGWGFIGIALVVFWDFFGPNLHGAYRRIKTKVIKKNRQDNLMFAAIAMAVAFGAIVAFGMLGMTAIQFPKEISFLSNSEFQTLLFGLGVIFLLAIIYYLRQLRLSEQSSS